MDDEKKLESKVESTGFWVDDGLFWGPINSGRDRLTRDRKILCCDADTKYIVTTDGKILNPQGKETGYFFDETLHVLGPEYGTLPWMREKAERLPPKKNDPADYGMDLH